jgi:ABC-type multidrug transport system fused ATPase/permease subunit
MIKANQIGGIISRLRSLLTRKHKAYLVALFFLTLLLSLIETIGVSVIMPFISVASTPAILEKGRFHAIYAFFGFESVDNFIIAFGVAIVIFYIIRSAYNVIYTYILNRFALGTYRYLAKILYGRFLAIPYKVYTGKIHRNYCRA